MTAIIIFLDITDSPMPNHAVDFKPMWATGSLTMSRTAAWRDRQPLPFIADGVVRRSICASGSAYSSIVRPYTDLTFALANHAPK
jgi:hypothetical protein